LSNTCQWTKHLGQMDLMGCFSRNVGTSSRKTSTSYAMTSFLE